MPSMARSHYEKEDKNKVHLTCVDFYVCPATIYIPHLYQKFLSYSLRTNTVLVRIPIET